MTGFEEFLKAQLGELEVNILQEHHRSLSAVLSNGNGNCNGNGTSVLAIEGPKSAGEEAGFADVLPAGRASETEPTSPVSSKAVARDSRRLSTNITFAGELQRQFKSMRTSGKPQLEDSDDDSHHDLTTFKVWREWGALQRSESSAARLVRRKQKSMMWEDISNSSNCFIQYNAYSTRPRTARFCTSLQMLIISPNSRRSLCWGSLGMLLILYDVIAIPMQVFDVTDPNFMSWILRIYWTLDIFVNFITGFDQQGSFVVSPPAIAWRYLTGWFILDIFLVAIEWGLLTDDDEDTVDDGGVEEAIGLARFGKTFRAARLFRLLRLFRVLRLMKLPLLFAKIEERIQNETAVILISIFKLTVGILIINHCFACGWFYIGSGLEFGWVTRLKFNESPWGYQYATALHWSLTQFTPASMEVFPANPVERGYAIVVLIFALVTFSSFVSSITNAMTRLRNMNSEYAKQFLIFQRYLRARGISTVLAVRMRRHLEHRLLRGHKMVEEKDVEVLALLSQPLLMELHFEVYARTLSCHPFFDYYIPNNAVAARKLCHFAVNEFTLSAGDTLFSVGEVCNHMHIIKSGIMSYVIQSGEVEDQELSEEVCHKTVVGEACIWTHWMHVGQMVAHTKATLLSLEAAKFREVACCCRSQSLHVWQYARLYVDYLNTVEFLTDLDVGFDSVSALERSFVGVDEEEEEGETGEASPRLPEDKSENSVMSARVRRL
eukprot:TRINITY_DN25101_c0_g1_i1.p1 TRINITY_DN25101_c0_g1~~TRINITY_DN25101_c0_g1_i1.p1  ORF type:complete len:720 (-),score=152.66 TRINITY_DN25101_c0_g1_i1:76-2235(-)